MRVLRSSSSVHFRNDNKISHFYCKDYWKRYVYLFYSNLRNWVICMYEYVVILLHLFMKSYSVHTQQVQNCIFPLITFVIVQSWYYINILNFLFMVKILNWTFWYFQSNNFYHVNISNIRKTIKKLIWHTFELIVYIIWIWDPLLL